MMAPTVPPMGEFAAFVIAGFWSGAIVGMTGVGGGSLMTPILIFFFGVKPYLAVGTDLLFAAFTKMGGTVKLARSGRIDWPVVLNLSAGSIPASMLTLCVPAPAGRQAPASRRHRDQHPGRGAATHRRGHGTGRGGRPPEPACARVACHRRAPATGRCPCCSARSSAPCVTLTSGGAGAIGVTVLMLLYPLLPLPAHRGCRHRLRRAADPGGWLGHATLGSVDWPMLAALLAGSIARHLARRHTW